MENLPSKIERGLSTDFYLKIIPKMFKSAHERLPKRDNMSVVDYYMCDNCGCKCFYDAELNWKDVAQDKMTLDLCGDIKAICIACAKTHKCIVVEIDIDKEDDDILNIQNIQMLKNY